jgi:hypothetical protein
MCYLETHSCACTEAWRRKIVHRRAIACLPNVDCLHRNLRGPNPYFWTSTYVKGCADFHKGPAPVVPYRCPVERVDEMNGSASFSESQRENFILGYIDLDYVTFHDHLNKTDDSDSGDFSEESLSTGDIDTGEFLDVRHQTGWMYTRLPDGTLVQIPDTYNPRGRQEGYDPTPDPEHLADADWDQLIETESHHDSDDPEDGGEAAAGAVTGTQATSH